MAKKIEKILGSVLDPKDKFSRAYDPQKLFGPKLPALLRIHAKIGIFSRDFTIEAQEPVWEGAEISSIFDSA